MIGARLILEDGSCFEGELFGAAQAAAGEVVFNTGMVGYAEAMTDPSYRGQLLTFTFPLIGNYGIPNNGKLEWADCDGEQKGLFQSRQIQVAGVILSRLSREFSHWSATQSLESWMQGQGISGLSGVDTRALTKKLRTRGSMLGKIVSDGNDVEWNDPNGRNLVAEVSEPGVTLFPGGGERRIILVDFGCKRAILQSLLRRRFDVLKVPWNHDWTREPADGIVLSNGPGDPKQCRPALDIIRRGLKGARPILGICLGHQLLALAAGADTFKLKYGHRGQNQPCIEVGTKRCYITSQNHGYAVKDNTLPAGWQPWFFNANDGTNEGMRHGDLPFFSVQFHPEAHPGPTDTEFVFDLFAKVINRG